MKRWKLFLPLFTFLAFCMLLLAGLFIDNKTVLPSALLDREMPAFSLTRLEEGEQITDSDLKGEVFLLNIWGSWCPACKVEHPKLVQLAEQGVRIIGVNYKDDPRQAARLLERQGNPYLYNIQDPEGRLGLDLGVYGSPEAFVVDHEGIIRYKHVGIVDARVWNGEIKPLYENLESERLKKESVL